MASHQQSETPAVFVVSRFEVRLISYNDHTLNDMLGFTIDPGPPARWTFAINDMNEQKWTWVVGVASSLEAAKTILHEERRKWVTEAGYFAQGMENKDEVRLFGNIEGREQDYRGKIYVEGPIELKK